MNLSKKIFYTLSIVISHVVLFTICFIWDYYDNNLTIKELPYMIIFYISIIILFFAVTNIAYNLSCNNEKVLYKKYQIHKIFSALDKSNKLYLFEMFCVSENNQFIINDLSQELTNSECEKLKHLYKLENKEEFEKYLNEISKIKSKKFNKQLESLNRPLYYQYFYEYHNNSLLKKKESIFGFLVGFISFIIAIVPLLGNQIPEISLFAYLDFADPLIFVITDFIAIYKSNVKTITNEYNEDLKDLEDSLKKYESQI